MYSLTWRKRGRKSAHWKRNSESLIRCMGWLSFCGGLFRGDLFDLFCFCPIVVSGRESCFGEECDGKGQRRAGCPAERNQSK